MAAVSNPRSHFTNNKPKLARHEAAVWDDRSAGNQCSSDNRAAMPATIRFPGHRTAGDDKLPSDEVIAQRIAAIQNSWSAEERKRRHAMSQDRQNELEILLACA